jgi:3-dehydroquinate dehydratase-2
LIIQIINGPNLNLLGVREPNHYGPDSLDSLKEYTKSKLPESVTLHWFQSNIEGEIVDKIQSLLNTEADGLIINPGGYSHTSVAIHDAMKIIKIPVIEVHLSNVYRREVFRHRLLTARAANKIMCGLGKDAYCAAAMGLLNKE